MSHTCTVRELVGTASRVPAHELSPRLTDSDTGTELHGQLASSRDAVEQALAVAEQVSETGSWTGLPQQDRADALLRLRDELASRVADLAEADSLDTGVPVHWTTALVTGRTGFLDLAAKDLLDGFERTELPSAVGPADQWRLPWGPAAVLLPWNAPAATAIGRISDALLAGCPVVLKPSEWAPHSTGPLVDAVLAADLPPGLVQVLHGGSEVGAAVVGDERIKAVSYTGGLAGGRAVAEACARQLTPVDLELSGNNPVLALPDADVQLVAQELAFGMQFLNGQICIGPRRLLVPRALVQAYVDALGEALLDVRIGSRHDPETTLGPLAHPGHVQQLQEQLRAVPGEVHRFGVLPDLGGHFLQPTVVVADDGADLSSEVFGPVLFVQPYDDEDSAVALANDHAFGLAAYVFGADRDRARAVGRRLRAGFVTVNAVLNSGCDAPAVGSMWGSSGIGTAGLGQGARFFSGHRFVG